jgi:hypothetical protein
MEVGDSNRRRYVVRRRRWRDEVMEKGGAPTERNVTAARKADGDDDRQDQPQSSQTIEANSLCEERTFVGCCGTGQPG